VLEKLREVDFSSFISYSADNSMLTTKPYVCRTGELVVVIRSLKYFFRQIKQVTSILSSMKHFCCIFSMAQLRNSSPSKCPMSECPTSSILDLRELVLSRCQSTRLTVNSSQRCCTWQSTSHTII